MNSEGLLIVGMVVIISVCLASAAYLISTGSEWWALVFIALACATRFKVTETTSTKGQ